MNKYESARIDVMYPEHCVLLETSWLSCSVTTPQVCAALSNSITLSESQRHPGPCRASSYNYTLTEVTTPQTPLLCEQPAGSGLFHFTTASGEAE